MAGYDRNFLEGVELPLPTFSPRLEEFVLRRPELEDGVYANYINYTVVTNRKRRAPIYSALNIDQNLIKQTERKDYWRTDRRIGSEFQLNNDYYRKNPWDRGHLARRASASWGDTPTQAQDASNDTFYYSNASLQHENFNKDEWVALEDWVLELALDKDGKITSFSGPVYGEYSRTIEPEGRQLAMVPCAFFKIVCFISKETDKLDVRAFLMLQDQDALADRSGRRLFNYQNYQVTVKEIENLTGLQFKDEIYEKNPLFYTDTAERRARFNVSSFPERIEVDSSADIIDANRTRDFIGDDDVDVFIAAAMVNPKGYERANEWISVINLEGKDMELDGWTLSDTKNKSLDIGKGHDGQRRVLRPGEAVAIKPIRPVVLYNDGGVIALYDKPEPRKDKGRRIDRVMYTKEQAKRQGIPVIFNHWDI